LLLKQISFLVVNELVNNMWSSLLTAKSGIKSKKVLLNEVRLVYCVHAISRIWEGPQKIFCFTFQSGIKSMEYDLVAKENLELKEKLEKVIN
jgi:hypothetical protein